jgi:pimeloyl-ACP methyl ester carboxylesterase
MLRHARRPLLLLLLIALPLLLFAAVPTFSRVSITTADGATLAAALFTGGEQAVVFVHGEGFTKESWYPLARRLQQRNVASLAVDLRGHGESPAHNGDAAADVLGAIAYLGKQGSRRIAVVAAGTGAAAALSALQQAPSTPVTHIVLLAPADGPAANNRAQNKLFIVSMGDPARPGVDALFRASAEPKKIRVFTGKAHAQHLFGTEHAGATTELILRFLRD